MVWVVRVKYIGYKYMDSLEIYKHYKFLYLKQKGGLVGDVKSTQLNCLIITHNARLRCFVKKLLGDKISNARFKNGVVLKVSSNIGHTTIEMIHEGEIDADNKKKGGYFILEKINPDDEIFQKQRLNLYFSIPINFYLIRHGEAFHNIKSNFLIKAMNFVVGRNKDTLLTETGIQQAESTGKALNKYFINQTIDHVFVSKLQRTRQTAVNILNQIDPLIKTKITELIVLPCSHELGFSKDGACDGKHKINPPENQMECVPENLSEDCREIDDYVIDWSYYVKFYGEEKKCRENDMLTLATQIAQEKKID